MPVRKRENEVARLLLEGCDNAEIAQRLGMARRTVKSHFNRMFRKFRIEDGVKRVKLAVLLYRKELSKSNQGSVNEINS
jgi:DNA-binding NarL/FixJ family response regulator